MNYPPVDELVLRAAVLLSLVSQLVLHTSVTTWSGSLQGVPDSCFRAVSLLNGNQVIQLEIL